jgi:hypothetical protein
MAISSLTLVNEFVLVFVTDDLTNFLFKHKLFPRSNSNLNFTLSIKNITFQLHVNTTFVFLDVASSTLHFNFLLC